MPVMDHDQKDVRCMFMQRALADWCYQSDRKKTLDYKANIRAFLKRYVVGAPVDNRDYVKTWRSDVFELRVQLSPHRENTRIFGAFVKQDTFVAVHPPKLRSDFGGMGDPRWDASIDHVLDVFADWGLANFVVPARPFSNCISTNCYDFGLRIGG